MVIQPTYEHTVAEKLRCAGDRENGNYRDDTADNHYALQQAHEETKDMVYTAHDRQIFNKSTQGITQKRNQ